LNTGTITAIGLKLGLVLFNEGCSVSLWDEFSRQSDKYTNDCCEEKWLTFRPDGENKAMLSSIMEWVTPIDDVFACQTFVKQLGDEIHHEDGLVYVFDPNTGLWDPSETALIAAVHRHKKALIFKQGKTILNYGGMTVKMNQMLRHLKSIVKADTFMSAGVVQTLEYLLFSDGIFHIPTQTFTPGFDITKVFTARIARPFPKKRDPELEAEVNRRLFIDPLQNVDVGRYLKLRLARSIAGCFRDKKFMVCLGDANSSKGTITSAMRGAFGGYVVEWNANYLKYNPSSGADEAKKLSWICAIKNARLALSNECRMDKALIDGNLLKTLSSGGDQLTVRQNFRDEVPVTLFASFFYFGNDLPEVSPKDSGIATRLRVVRFTKQFVEEPVGPHQVLADPAIKAKLLTDEWRNAIFWTIVDSYGILMDEPSEVVEETKEWVPLDDNRFRETLEELFTIDISNKNDTNYVAAREIISAVRGRGIVMSDPKIGRELKKLGLTQSDKRIGEKVMRVWRGIRIIQEFKDSHPTLT